MVLDDHIQKRLQNNDLSRIRKLSFMVNDISFHVMHTEESATHLRHVSLHAVLGYLPYSVESQSRRNALLSIVDAGHLLPHVRLGIDHQGRIFAAARYTSTTEDLADFLFQPLLGFLQETQPMIEIIGAYL